VLMLKALLEHMQVKRVLVQKLKVVLEQKSMPNSKANMVKLEPMQTLRQVEKHQLNLVKVELRHLLVALLELR
jgi:hypothetical protein